mgnify:CR=1 FL=1
MTETEYLKFEEKDYPEKIFTDKRGVFVTLLENSKLRGCIGNIEPIDLVGKLIIQNSVGAAFHDPRFLPLDIDELEDIILEVSILSKPQKLEYENDNELLNFLQDKKPGIIIESGSRRSTFLPSVWESLRNPTVFLSELSVKAGLASLAWRDKGVTINYYYAEKYKESI